MKKLLIGLLCLFLILPALAKSHTSGNFLDYMTDDSRVIAKPEQCQNEKIFKKFKIAESIKPYVYRAIVKIKNKTYEACWVKYPPKNSILLMYEDGDRGMVPMSALYPRV